MMCSQPFEHKNFQVRLKNNSVRKVKSLVTNKASSEKSRENQQITSLKAHTSLAV